MTTGRRLTSRPGPAFTVVSLLAAAIAGVLTAAAAMAANGPQTAPTIDPSPVPTAATAFTFSNGTCDGTGAAGWRVQTYIVNGGVDLSTLTFESGVGSDQVGTDRDNSNGSIRAPLYKGNVVGTGYNPAGSPAGLINPADLAGFSFSSAGWVLTDGTYQIGYACLDELSALRQWWSTTVTIDADASPNAFLIVGGGTGTTTTTSSTTTTTTGSTTTTTTASTTTTTSRGSTTTTTAGSGSTTSTTQASTVLGAQSSQGTGSSSLPATGQGLAVGGIALVLIYVGRVAYLLAQPRQPANRR